MQKSVNRSFCLDRTPKEGMCDKFTALEGEDNEEGPEKTEE